MVEEVTLFDKSLIKDIANAEIAGEELLIDHDNAKALCLVIYWGLSILHACRVRYVGNRKCDEDFCC